MVHTGPCIPFPASDLLVCVPEETKLVYILAPYSWMPYILLFSFGVYFLWKRTTFALFAGIFECGLGVLIEGILKPIMKQPRPAGTCACGYGMPSGHAAIATGFIVWFTLEMLFNNWKPKQSLVPATSKGKLLAIICLTAVLLPTGVSRVYLKYHSVEQVVIGSMIGGISATIYFYLLLYVLSNQLDDLVNLKIIQWLKIKNYYPKQLKNVTIFGAPLLEVKVV
eukprot:TRINITY_DN81_c1_g1_i1.p1 TRINITY_DN81_c1_g1~~TRINITY_DN81_c1_g1_i1.p1  ORF type:complete len:224 (-),score=100.28 TRINITY_DN81_c1_g1_i1:54-725(-)